MDVLTRSLVVVLLIGMPVAAQQSDVPTTQPVSRIAFGSCSSQLKPLPIFDVMAKMQPDMLLLLGDNMYADIVDGKLQPATPERIARAYLMLAAMPSFQRLRAAVPIVMGTWDDHDYGDNDAGAEWEHKQAAQTLFLDFFGVPEKSPRRSREGVYHAEIFGPPGQRVQVIMLDTRYFRSPIEKQDEALPGTRIRPYIPNDDHESTLLGSWQWGWLDQELRKPAELRLICSSIQVISAEHPFEKWANFPHERDRLFQFIRETGANGVVFLSGDRHLGELSLLVDNMPYPLYDLTASGLNQARDQWRGIEPNPYRVAGMPFGDHFGWIEIDWAAAEPTISLELRDAGGEIVIRHEVPLGVLQSQPAPGSREPTYR